MKKSFVRGTWQVKRAFSPAVIAAGAGRTIFIAGHTGQTDDAGKSLAGDFDAQFKQTFRNIEKTLAEAGAKLSDMVTMTVFLIDARYTTRMTELRTELFGKDFPASAAITVQGFAQPEMMIEVQGIAVTFKRCVPGAAQHEQSEWRAADPGSFKSVTVPDQRCTAISAGTRVFDALWRCTASGKQGKFP
jgi:2-iminobutanoate/2-iminopropanoate deaminase